MLRILFGIGFIVMAGLDVTYPKCMFGVGALIYLGFQSLFPNRQ